MTVLGLIRLVTYGHGSSLITGGVGTGALLTGLGMAYIGSTLAGFKPRHLTRVGHKRDLGRLERSVTGLPLHRRLRGG